MMYIHHTELGKKSFKRCAVERFGEDVSWLLRGTNWKQMEEFFLELFTYNMTVQIYVLCALMEGWIVGDLSGGLAIAVKGGLLSGLDLQISKEITQPL